MPTTTIEPLGKVRTKIVATVGPASRSPEILRALIAAGVDLFRLNFSHGSHEIHTANLAAIRAAAEEAGRVVGVLQDLCGPKMRLGEIPGDEVLCNLGDRFRLVDARTCDDPHELTCTYRNLAHDLKAGDSVLFADGTVGMTVIDVGKGVATLEVTLPGRLRSHQGVNLPGADLKVRALTDKDLADLDWTAEHPVDYVGLSFVRTPWDVDLLRWELERRKIDDRTKIVVKIEKPQAVAELEGIVERADAVMIARGDLGVELDVAKVPAVQKRIITVCHQLRRPVITATQMLSSMESSSRPTRAEAADIFNAILDGTDAVMLSGETAIGEYPVEAVAMMSRIAVEAEAQLRQRPAVAVPAGDGRIGPITESMVEAASVVCRRLDAKLLVVATHKGHTALAVSKFRHPTPTLALTTSAEVARQMSLYWGVTPIMVPEITGAVHALSTALKWARDREIVNPGDRIALLVSTIPGVAVHNALLVEEVRADQTQAESS